MINLRLIIYSLTAPESKEVGWLHKINDVLVLSFYDNGEWKCISSDITEELINAETINRTLADAALDIRIGAEANTRNSADIALSSAINIESSYRANADALLNSDIVAEKTRATTVENTIGTSVGLNPETKIYTNTGLYIGKLVVNTITSDIKALDTLTKNLSAIIDNKVTVDPNKSLVDNTEIKKLLALPTWDDTLAVIKNNAPVSHYNYNIKKTYDSVSSMNADKAAPIGTDKLPIKIGDIVNVVNNTTPSENGIYSYQGSTSDFEFQSSFNFQVEQSRSQNPNTSPSSKLVDDELDKKISIKTGINLFNKEDSKVTKGYFINSIGSLQLSTNYTISNYIPVKSGLSYTKSYTNENIYSAFYNKDKVLITNSESNNQIVTATEDGYIRVSILNTSLDNYMLVTGISLPLQYVRYTPIQVGVESLLDGSVTSEKLLDRSVTIEKTNFITLSNLYNPNDSDVVDGYFLNNDGLPINANGSYKTTGFIKVHTGDVIYNGNLGVLIPLRFLYGYNESKVKIDGSEDENRTSYVVPDGVKYIRTSFSKVGYSSYQINIGSIKAYNTWTYGPKIDSNLIEVTSESLLDRSVTIEKTNFININLYNPNADDVVVGYYLNNEGLPINEKSDYITTGFIKVKEGDTIYNGDNGVQIPLRFLYGYSSDKIKISGSEDMTRMSYTVPVGVSYIRTSFSNDYHQYQINIGSIKAYNTWGPKIDSNLIDFDAVIDDNTLLGKEAKRYSEVSLTDGNIINISDFPFHLKKGLEMSVQAKFSTFNGSILYGKGYNQYRGDWLEIDNTNIYWKHCEDSVTIQGTVAHNLSINTFIKSTFYIDNMSVVHIILQTLGGYFTTTFQWGYEANFAPFLKTIGQDLTDVQVNCTSLEFQHPVWAFGDSYFGVVEERWPGVMKKFGFFNFLLDGLAGQGSSGAYSDLMRCLNYGTPKFLLWFLGMNDSDNSFETYAESIISLCNYKKITLVLSTTPSCPARDKEIITNFVRNRGYRYVDFYKAVGAVAGAKQVMIANFTDAITSGKITLNLDGINYAIEVTAGETANNIIQAFNSLIFTNWTSNVNNGLLTLSRTITGVPTYSFSDTGQTGTTCTFNITTQGTYNSWYSGYCEDDITGVHPTELGAQALATQVLIDFPELMQYGNIN